MNKEEQMKLLGEVTAYCIRNELVTLEEIKEMQANGRQKELAANLYTIARLHKKAHPEAK